MFSSWMTMFWPVRLQMSRGAAAMQATLTWCNLAHSSLITTVTPRLGVSNRHPASTSGRSQPAVLLRPGPPQHAAPAAYLASHASLWGSEACCEPDASLQIKYDKCSRCPPRHSPPERSACTALVGQSSCSMWQAHGGLQQSQPGATSCTHR